MMSAFPLESARLSRLWILCQSLGDLCKKIYFHIFSFFPGFQTWFYQISWFYLYRSFKNSKWSRHKLCHI